MVATDELEKVSRAFVPLFHLKVRVSNVRVFLEAESVPAGNLW